VVDNGFERQFTYFYGAIRPQKGEMDWIICDKMNTERMNEFLIQVSAAHPRELIIMILDGASSHWAKALALPHNIRLVRLPAYAPELNPQERIWDELREKEFPDRVFDDMAGVIRQLDQGLPRLAADSKRLRSTAGWPWIMSRLNLKAN
jgi:transposase